MQLPGPSEVRRKGRTEGGDGKYPAMLIKVSKGKGKKQQRASTSPESLRGGKKRWVARQLGFGGEWTE